MFVYYFLFICIGVGVVPFIGEVVASCPHLPTLPNTLLRCILPQNDRITLCPGPGYLTPRGTIAYFQCSEDSVASTSLSSDSNGLGFLRCNEGRKWDGLSGYYILKCTRLDPELRKIECGVSNFISTVPLISYGEEADVTDWPWFSAIFEYYEDKWQFVCGGSLINPIDQHLVVLTAAHCLVEVSDASLLRVVLSPRSSDFSINKRSPDTREHIYEVEQFEIHRNYSPFNNHENDVGIIKLRGKIKLNQNIMPACWPGNHDDLEQFAEKSKSAVLIGFGRDESGMLSKRLKRSLMPVYTYKKCHSVFDMKALDTQFCAGYQTGAAACKGDSGSGLAFRNPVTGRFFVQGIVSIGFIDLTSGTCENVAVYTRISKFFSWIESTTVKLNPKIPFSTTTTTAFPSTSKSLPRSTSTTSTPVTSSSPRIFSTPSTTASSRTPIFSSSLEATKTTTEIISTSYTTPNPIVSNSSQGPIKYPAYAKLAEKLHNCYRSRHGAPEVTLNATLNDFAKTWAEYLHQRGSLESMSSMDYVTNEFSTIYDSNDPEVNVRRAVTTWYNQMKYYQWDEPKPNAFSLMVWETVKTIGVSVITVGRKTITVTAYSPPGNVIHSIDPSKHFKEKVFPIRNSHICSY